MEWSEHFDSDAFDMLKEVMEEEFTDLLCVYIEDADERLPQIRSALNQGDAATLRELAHSFKGASGNIAASSLSELCFTLETAAKNNQLSDMDGVVSAIETEYAVVKQLLGNIIH